MGTSLGPRPESTYERSGLSDANGFKRTLRKRSVLLAASGFFLGSLSLVGLQTDPNWLQISDFFLRAASILGFALAGAGLFVTMATWNENVLEMTKTVSQASADIGSHSTMVDQVRGMLRGDTAVLSFLKWLSFDTLYQSTEGSTSKEYVRAMVGRALVHFLARDYKKYVDRLETIIRDPKQVIEFDDERLIGLSLEELEALLPDGSIWCGVSLVAKEEAESDILKAFYARSRTKVSNGTLKMRVIYVIGEGASWVSRERAEEDSKKGVQVRTTRKDLKDISLVWIPNPTTDASSNGEPTDLFDVIENHQPIALLEFELSMGILRKLSVHSGTSDKFASVYTSFKTDWNAADSL